MNSTRIQARTAGALFLLAMAASLTGGGLLESILGVPDFLTTSFYNEYVLKTGVLLEIVNALAVIGIAVTLYPILRAYNERIALGYFALRLIESIVCLSAAFIPLLMVTLVGEHARIGIPEGSTLQSFGVSLLAVRNIMASLIIPLFFSLGAFLFYSLLYQYKLIPRFISVWGWIGALLILASTSVGTKGVAQVVMVLPIILNEIFLGIWLIVKGFSQKYDQEVKQNH